MFSLPIDTARTWRGGQQQVLLTVLGLRELGHRAALVAHPEGELRRRAAEGHDLVPLAPRSEIDLGAAWRLARVLRDLGPEIVHAHDAHGVALASLALSLGRLAPAPLLIASRRVDFHLQGNSFSRWKYRQVDGFIAASEAIRAMLVADGIAPGRVVTVHEGIDIDRVTAGPPAAIHAELWLPTHAPVVGNVAALVPHKGQRHLIEAAALVVREVPDARFVILGEGELRPALERQIRELRLDKHVILAGFRPDVLAFHRAFDVFVMSSVTEGLGTSLLDAMASSRAIVATEAGGIPEVVVDGETGLLVPPRNHQAMAAAIVRLLKDPALRERLGRAGFERVRSRFSAARMVDQTLDVYRAWLAAAPHRGGAGGRGPAADTPSRPPRG
jgi:glycosyltransferase involved in cell wall biosynthesis